MNKKDIQPSEFKTILHSKRANIYYLEKCRVMQKDGRILYLTAAKDQNLYWNIPIGNTTVILLGTGTSITQAAVRMLSQAGVLVGFCGGGGTPLYAGTAIEWMTPQSEYRPTEYVQGWLSFWFNDEKRLLAAKELQKMRCDYFCDVWEKDRELAQYQFFIDDMELETSLNKYDREIDAAKQVTDLLSAEAHFTKALYKYAAWKTEQGDFKREHNATDKANGFLDHGNYLAYGLAATALWVLGIPHGFALMHGKTRRGALVFDIADLIKDAIVLPQAFICAKNNLRDNDFRQICLVKFTEHKALDYMFDKIEKLSRLKFAEVPE